MVGPVGKRGHKRQHAALRVAVVREHVDLDRAVLVDARGVRDGDRRLIDIPDVDGDGDGVGAAKAVVGGDGERVSALPELVVEGDAVSDPYLARGAVDRKLSRAAQRVHERVVLSVGRPHRAADIPARGGVLENRDIVDAVRQRGRCVGGALVRGRQF